MASKYARFLYQVCRPAGENGKSATACKAHTELCRTAAAEGMVLLKNINDALPLLKGERIALFGNSTIDYVKCGGGSGIVHSPYIRTVLDGLRLKEQEGKVSVFSPLAEYYAELLKNAERAEMPHQDYALVEELDIPDNLLHDAAKFANTAIFTIGRLSTEGEDHGAVAGDFLLSENEEKLIKRITEHFSKVIIVLDIGIMIDTNPFKDNPKISALLFAGLGGMEGGLAIADILCGDVNPSGKLADTWASDFSEYPSSEGFNESDDYVNYTEDIYVGYRYFETVPGKKDKVNYPFGYGLSYTEFRIDGVNGFGDGEYITFAATVTNIGKRAGKEVVQVYCEAPQGLLGKAKRSLIAFKKTKLLKPGESETLAMRVKTEALASYDDLGKIQQAAYVLEKGEYFFHVGTSVRDTVKTDYTYVLRDNVIVKQFETRCAPELLEKRMLSDGSYEALPSFPKVSHRQENTPNKAEAPKEAVMFEAVGDTVSLDEFMAQLTDDELIEQLGGQPSTGIGDTGSMGGLKRLGIPRVAVSDGPAGLRTSRECGIFPTTWPCETLLACTWNPEITEAVGRAGGLEVIENNFGVWLAPGMNIHRSQMCGRNFEYYSEDPLLTGKMGAAMVRGIQSCGVAPSVKHFACNNKEKNRIYSDSRVSERALREIYLKGFEICIAESDPWMIMTSYNLLNGEHTSAKYELLNGILRGEWGYDGLLTTDWEIRAPHSEELSAGNDIKMPTGEPDDLKKALNEGKITRADLEHSAANVLKMIIKLAH